MNNKYKKLWNCRAVNTIADHWKWQSPTKPQSARVRAMFCGNQPVKHYWEIRQLRFFENLPRLWPTCAIGRQEDWFMGFFFLEIDKNRKISALLTEKFSLILFRNVLAVFVWIVEIFLTIAWFIWVHYFMNQVSH